MAGQPAQPFLPPLPGTFTLISKIGLLDNVKDKAKEKLEDTIKKQLAKKVEQAKQEAKMKVAVYLAEQLGLDATKEFLESTTPERLKFDLARLGYHKLLDLLADEPSPVPAPPAGPVLQAIIPPMWARDPGPGPLTLSGQVDPADLAGEPPADSDQCDSP